MIANVLVSSQGAAATTPPAGFTAALGALDDTPPNTSWAG
jgi:hypothetical protein